ncbi:uncharacterized protein [Centruroides vittatus]|uniref:uncharacterized protein n=1 Tax=Centruroides vittatus TaxID=120091 RepID=UPI00350FBDE5
MDSLLKPERFNVDPNISGSSQQWSHWYRTFENFVSSTEMDDVRKFSLLVNFVGPLVYTYISECSGFQDAIKTLTALYEKPINVIFARHCLINRRQQPGESIDQYYQNLRTLSKDCNFTSVSAEEYKSEYVRDAFIAGLLSPQIRQRLLESHTLKLVDALSQARALESACVQSESFVSNTSTVSAIHISNEKELAEENLNNTEVNALPSHVLAATERRCPYCGYMKHLRNRCPARNEDCNRCGKRGHFSRVCKSKGSKPTAAAVTLATVAHSPLSRATVNIQLNNILARALVDTGSSESFIDYNFALCHRLQIIPHSAQVSMATTALSSTVRGRCIVSINLKGHTYPNVSLSALSGLCADVILGHDFLALHTDVSFKFGGSHTSLLICSAVLANVPPAHLFKHLSKDTRPIATKSRRFSKPDQDFIDAEIKRLTAEGIIEESNSPWRAQVVIVPGPKKKVISFGLTNGVAGFQRSISQLITKEGLVDTFAYLDDVTVCERTQEEHDRNLTRFMDMALKIT